jgi:hypothetical protein
MNGPVTVRCYAIFVERGFGYDIAFLRKAETNLRLRPGLAGNCLSPLECTACQSSDFDRSTVW